MLPSSILSCKSSKSSSIFPAYSSQTHFLCSALAWLLLTSFSHLNGQIWGTSQIFATTYLLLFYLFYFRFLNSEKHSQLILCVVFFWLACLSRYVLLFNGILFIYLFLYCKTSGRAIPTKIILSLALLTMAF